VAIPTRKNHPNVAPSDPCCCGVTNSANFNPGESSISTAAGMVGSFCAASANPTNPNGNATTAGKITRNSNRAFMNLHFISLLANAAVSDSPDAQNRNVHLALIGSRSLPTTHYPLPHKIC